MRPVSAILGPRHGAIEQLVRIMCIWYKCSPCFIEKSSLARVEVLTLIAEDMYLRTGCIHLFPILLGGPSFFLVL